MTRATTVQIRKSGPPLWLSLLTLGAMAASTLARAEGEGPDPKALAISESLVTYCTKVDSESAAKYRDRIKALVKGVSNDSLAKVRGSDAYRNARASMDDFVSKIDDHNAKRMCSNGLAAHTAHQ